MDDRMIMENLLNTAKGVCDLYMHGAVEAVTPGVRQAFTTALNFELGIQDELFREMQRRGWYAPEEANAQRTQQIKQKYQPGCCG
ncbi:MAG TPA: spore coat protein [Candidatus Scatomorpha stercoravium]|nr:spore coat protein [Candidatus Scatomorpha stercoravium]